MRGLILKDLYTMARNMRTYFVIIAIVTLIPGDTSTTVSIAVAGMLPLMSLAYDERCGWDTLAASMPYTVRQLVMSKYAIGIIFMVLTLSIKIITFPIISAINKDASFAETCMSMLGAVWASLVMQSITVPISFRFGTESARRAMIVFMLAVVMILGAINHLIDTNKIDFAFSSEVFTIFGILGFVAYILSIPLSMRGYVLGNRED
ncbi:MAG: ABC-2 transporter permease [Candidatus Fimadaptatus sp.]|jgi:ABC-2 type transport system permease protein